jgi:microcystin-dependent protein
MGLETASFINQLNVNNPVHTDPVDQADSHLRLIKSVLQAQFPNFTAAAIASTNAQIDAVVTTGLTNSGQLGLVGEPRLWLSNTLPTIVGSGASFIFLNGQAISRTTFPQLFALWGTLYGSGDGTSTFNVPNFQEAVPVGQSGMGGGTDPDLFATGSLGPTLVGNATVTVEQTNLPNVNFTLNGSADTSSLSVSTSGSVSIPAGQGSHTHPTSPALATVGVSAGSGFTGIIEGTGQIVEAATLPAMSGTFSGSGSIGSNATLSGTAASGGSGTAMENIQPSIVVNWITLAA